MRLLALSGKWMSAPCLVRRVTAGALRFSAAMCRMGLSQGLDLGLAQRVLRFAPFLMNAAITLSRLRISSVVGSGRPSGVVSSEELLYSSRSSCASSKKLACQLLISRGVNCCLRPEHLEWLMLKV
ncbi:hypothetical protein BJY04DRAFT_201419 [Aspergillus karnatakaensis]|uniref:uncharacterized protein n=1 Tax=Aspergillus karnatakaensis TaxID=1810916 RepID=UPI003CCDC3E3